MHSRPGKITNIRDHEDGKHAEITITHGKRKRMGKGVADGSNALVSYHQHRSSIIVPKAHAANYALGQKVNAGIEANDSVGDDDFDDVGGATQNGAASEAAAVPGKQSGTTSVRAAKVKAPGKSKANLKLASALGKKK